MASRRRIQATRLGLEGVGGGFRHVAKISYDDDKEEEEEEDEEGGGFDDDELEDGGFGGSRVKVAVVEDYEMEEDYQMDEEEELVEGAEVYSDGHLWGISWGSLAKRMTLVTVMSGLLEMSWLMKLHFSLVMRFVNT